MPSAVTVVPDTTFDEDAPLTFGDRCAKIWIVIFSCIPNSIYLFDSFPVPGVVLRDKHWKSLLSSKDEEALQRKYKVRGVFNFWNILDCVFVRWSSYLDRELTDDSIIVDQLKNDCQNIGLLAALVATIDFAMLQITFSLEFDGTTLEGILFIVSWTMASIFTIAATVMSVFLLMAVDETKTIRETLFFIKLLNYLTYDIGTMSPLVLFYCGICFAVIGLSVGSFIYFGWFTLLIGMSSAGLCFFFFLYSYMHMVSALHMARETTQFLEMDSKRISLSVDSIKVLLKEYMKDNDISVEELGSVEEFIDYIVERDFLPAQKISGDVLFPVTELRVKKIFAMFIDANLLQHVDIDVFDQRGEKTVPC